VDRGGQPIKIRTKKSYIETTNFTKARTPSKWEKFTLQISLLAPELLQKFAGIATGLHPEVPILNR